MSRLAICAACGELGMLTDGLCCLCTKAVKIRRESAPKYRGKCLDEAKNVINGERQDQYGSPEDSFRTIADYWSTYLGVELTAGDVAKMMVLFKVARMSGQADDIDNYIDAAGYIGIAGDML